ncbi:Hypothetical_protein [Hexamita inflata]|uniref:Hypothetical_protein n=1 Tax=Hexamita inflata TaxID=28002 RepID=A0AA86R0Y8_9EUKA|nr:Hypothetical protein HINF_LOCUS52021 [Hexamita inflata]CAI9967072.1 Hypothetical protein HINF_LOCUS54717 [Hexamita inflata]
MRSERAQGFNIQQDKGSLHYTRWRSQTILNTTHHATVRRLKQPTSQILSWRSSFSQRNVPEYAGLSADIQPETPDNTILILICLFVSILHDYCLSMQCFDMNDEHRIYDITIIQLRYVCSLVAFESLCHVDKQEQWSSCCLLQREL